MDHDATEHPEPLARMPTSRSLVRDPHALPPSIVARASSAISVANASLSPTDREPRVGVDDAFNLTPNPYNGPGTDAEWRAEAMHMELAGYESEAVDDALPIDIRRYGRIFQDTEIGAVSELNVVPQDGKRKWLQRASSAARTWAQSTGKKLRQLSIPRKDSGQSSGNDADKDTSPSLGEDHSPPVLGEQATGGEENRTTINVREVQPLGTTTPQPTMSRAHRIAPGIGESTSTLSASAPEQSSSHQSPDGDMANSTGLSSRGKGSRADRAASLQDGFDFEDKNIKRDGGALQRHHTEAVLVEGRTSADFDNVQRLEENEEPLTLKDRQQRIAKHLAEAQQRGAFDEDLEARFRQDTGNEQDQQIAREILAREKDLYDRVYQRSFVQSELSEIFGRPHKLTRRNYFRKAKLRAARETQEAREYYELLRNAELSAWRRARGKYCNPRDEVAVEDLPEAPNTEAGRRAVEALKARRRATIGQNGRPLLGHENFRDVELPPLEGKARPDS